MTDIKIDALEPNSRKYRAEKAKESQNIDKPKAIISKDQMASMKKPLGKKFKDSFLSEDASDLKTWLLVDVIIPGVKNTLLDMLSMMFFGEMSSRSDRRGSSRSRVNYSSFYRSSSDRDERRSYNRRDRDYKSSNKIDYRNIVLRSRSDAERLVDEMYRRIQDSTAQSVSVADLLELIDEAEHSSYNDNNWGWTSEKDIGIRRVSSGYLIDLSEPKYLN